MNWEDYRRGDGTINLREAFISEYGELGSDTSLEYLAEVERLKEVVSTQVAAIALTTANMMKVRWS